MSKKTNTDTERAEKRRAANRETQAQRNAILKAKAEEKGWDGWISFATAVINDEAEIPEKGKTK